MIGHVTNILALNLNVQYTMVQISIVFIWGITLGRRARGNDINFEMKACACILTLTLILMVVVEQTLEEGELYYLQAVWIPPHAIPTKITLSLPFLPIQAVHSKTGSQTCWVAKYTCLYLKYINPLNPELNPICYLLALLGPHHFLHVSRIRVKISTFRRLMSYIYGAPILDVFRSHTTTQHSR